MAPDEHTRPASDCAATRERIAAFIGGRLVRDEAAALRAHRKQCAACEAEWRASIRTTSDLHRRPRVSEDREAREERRAEHRRLALAGAFASSTRPARRVRRARQRLLLLPALTIVLMLVVYPMSPGSPGSLGSMARLEVLAGEVELSHRTLRAGESGVALRRGDWFATGPGTRARLTFQAAQVEVGPRTRVLVEDGRTGRVRLVAGALVVRGDGVVTSDLGVVQVTGGEGRVRTVSAGLEVEGLEGSVVVARSTGEETVSPGERTLLTVR